MVSRRVSRRSFLRRIVGPTVLAGGSLALVGCGPVLASGGCTDGDAGPGSDPAGRGRGCEKGERTGLSDNDMGANSDSLGYGRGARASAAPSRRSGLTDNDGGANSDPPGYGRTGNRGSWGARNGVTDRDAGANADQAGEGRSGGWGRSN